MNEDPTDSGRRVERGNPPARDHGSPMEPLAPAAPAWSVPAYGVNGYGIEFFIHRVQRPYGTVYFSECGNVVIDVPEGVRPTSRFLKPCKKCFPDGHLEVSP